MELHSSSRFLHADWELSFTKNLDVCVEMNDWQRSSESSESRMSIYWIDCCQSSVDRIHQQYPTSAPAMPVHWAVFSIRHLITILASHLWYVRVKQRWHSFTIIDWQFDVPRGRIAHGDIAYPKLGTPFIKNYLRQVIRLFLRPCQKSVRLWQAGYKMLQRFYHCSGQSNVQTKWALRSHEDTYTQHQHLCRSSEVLGWSAPDSRHW